MTLLMEVLTTIPGTSTGDRVCRAPATAASTAVGLRVLAL